MKILILTIYGFIKSVMIILLHAGSNKMGICNFWVVTVSSVSSRGDSKGISFNLLCKFSNYTLECALEYKNFEKIKSWVPIESSR